MTKRHLLIEKSARFPIATPGTGEGWHYRRQIGAWVDAEWPDRLMVDPDAMQAGQPANPTPAPRPRPKPPGPMTKKNDIETGEDLKGE